MRFPILIALHLILLCVSIKQASAQNFDITSPDKRIKLSISIEKDISWLVSLDDDIIINDAIVGMEFTSGRNIGKNPKVRNHSIKQHTSIINPIIPNKDSEIKDEFVELRIGLVSKYDIIFRA